MLPAHPQRDPAGDQRLDLRTRRQKLRDLRSGLNHLLEVVENEQQLLGWTGIQRVVPLADWFGWSRRPSACPIAGITSAGSRIAVRETKTRVTKWAPRPIAACVARRVLPIPAGPVSVSNRTSFLQQQMRDGGFLALASNERSEGNGEALWKSRRLRRGEQQRSAPRRFARRASKRSARSSSPKAQRVGEQT